MGIMKSEIDIVIDDNANKRITLSMKIKLLDALIEIVNRKPNRTPAKDVKTALSRITVP